MSLLYKSSLFRSYFKEVPSLNDFHYRARKLKEVVQAVIVEGAGIECKRKTYLKRVKDHLRCEVVVTKKVQTHSVR